MGWVPRAPRRLGTPLPTADRQCSASEAAVKLSRASVSPRQLEVSVSRTRSTQDAAPEPLCSLPRLVLVACIAHPRDADFSVCEASRSRAAKIILIDDVSVSRTRSTRPAAPEPLSSLPRLVLVACIRHPRVARSLHKLAQSTRAETLADESSLTRAWARTFGTCPPRARPFATGLHPTLVSLSGACGDLTI